MQAVLVVAMPVSVLERLVRVLVIVPFPDMEPDAPGP